MFATHEDAYLESRVYSATPAELTLILYETTLQSVHEAIEAETAEGLDDVSRITSRARGICRASSCVMELAGSLNVGLGGELGVRLAVLYEYLLHELLEASTGRQTQPLRNAERVLSALMEGWSQATEGMPEEVTASDAPAGQQSPSVQDAIPFEAPDPEDQGDEDFAESRRGTWCA